MRTVTASVVLVALFTIPAHAQQSAQEAEIRRDVPYEAMRREMPGLTLDQYNMAIREVAKREMVAADLLVVSTPATVSSFPLPRHAPSTPAPLASPALQLPATVGADGVVSIIPFDPSVVTNPFANLFSRDTRPFSPPFLTNPFAASPAKVQVRFPPQ